MTVSVRKKHGVDSGLPRGEMRQLKEYKQTTYQKTCGYTVFPDKELTNRKPFSFSNPL